MYIPSNIILEVSALCNVSCLGCALHGPHGFVTRPFGNMKKDIWEPVIREIGTCGQKVSLTTHGGGEPLMSPDLRDILTFARSFPNINVGFLTNGMLMNESWAEFVIDIDLDWIAFSIDGVIPETHDQIRQKSNLIQVEKNLETLLELKQKKTRHTPEVKINMVAYDNIIDQKDSFVEKWIDKVDAVMVSHYRNPPESKRWPGVPLERKPCKLLWSQAVVAWDGRLGLCCEDFNIDHSPGSVGKNSSLLELWNGSEFTKVRDLHRQGLFEKHPMCSKCDTWAEEYSRENFFDNEKGYNVIQSPAQTLYCK